MSKILLVEDDNNLREIYEARLQAEGYDIVSARDGEEALTVAMKERPDLIISDVMMPKISGFDMLDIIRSTEETKDVKVIMMTALSQAEDKARAEKLGADRYLVKSQVTLEDVAKVAREVLNGESPSEEAPAPAAPAPEPTPEVLPPAPVVAAPDDSTTTVTAPDPTPAVVGTPATDDATPSSNPALAAIAPEPSTDEPLTEEQTAIAAQIESFIDSKKTGPEATTEPTPVVETPAEPVATEPTPVVPEVPAVPAAPVEPAPVVTEVPVEPEKVEVKTDASASAPSGKKVIQPISDPTASKESDLNSLLEKEEEKDQMKEIAKSLAIEKADVADELSAEAALRSAAREKKDDVVPADESEIKITEDGDLKLTVEPPVVEAPVDTTPEVDASDAPTVALPTPAPVTNGTNIDGVVPTTPVQPSTPAEPKPPSSGVDPDLISL